MTKRNAQEKKSAQGRRRVAKEAAVAEPWYGVRCVFHWTRQGCFEERITIWKAASFEEALGKAEKEAAHYANHVSELGVIQLDFAQAFHLFDRPREGAEVYSLLRSSRLKPNAYLGRYFATGQEIEGEPLKPLSRETWSE